jgi:hypothetical protein
MESCVICNQIIGPEEQLKRVAGWPVHDFHPVFIKPSKFASRCMRCGGTINAGDYVVLSKEGGPWVVLHPCEDCSNGSNGEKKSSRSYVKEEKGSDPYEALYLLPSAPIEVVRATYRALAMLHHPDCGGTHDQMARINSAMDKIMGRLG